MLSTMQKHRRRGSLIERVLELRLWGDSPFFLLDVGCSGGVESRWRALGDRLRAVGFDPLVAEIDRLTATDTHPGIRYEAALVNCPDYDRLFPPALRNDRIASRNNTSFPRVSAAAAMARMPTSYIQEVFNKGAPVVVTERQVALDEYVASEEYPCVDFIKIDTDGHDIEVILGARNILSAGGALGLSVEAQFHGAAHDYSNTFSNIDRILRHHGFTLFDLPICRYSRAELPAPFVVDLPAQTISGQVQWAEALYFRDLGARDYGQMWPYEITPERVMKLAVLFDLFDLPDCAAELLLNRADFLPPDVRADLLDLLVSGAPGSYAARVADFERDYTRFYPSRMTAAATGRDSRMTHELQEKITKLTEKNVALREKLASERDRRAQMVQQIDELKAKRPAKTGGGTT
jgi:methyltransferase FkbM-like protein